MNAHMHRQNYWSTVRSMLLKGCVQEIPRLNIQKAKIDFDIFIYR